MEIKSIKKVVSEIIASKSDVGGVKQIYFIACGGSLAAYHPAKILLEQEAHELRVGYVNSSEFLNATPKAFGKNSVIITTSHRGNTPETVACAKVAKEMGVPVIAVTYTENSPITEYADYVLSYTFGDDRDVAGEKTMVGLQLAVEFLNQTEGYEHYDAFYNGVSKINEIVQNAKGVVAQNAEAFALAHKDDKVIYTMGSGASWGSAHMQSICIFMEMQWINSSTLHTGEFFHGPFEIIDDEIPFILQIAEGPTRVLDERALNFLGQYSKRYDVLDARELGLSAIDSCVVDYFNHSLFNNLYGLYNRKLAEVRNHPLTTRRYMWKVQY